jgi:hypothetical protein
MPSFAWMTDTARRRFFGNSLHVGIDVGAGRQSKIKPSRIEILCLKED